MVRASARSKEKKSAEWFFPGRGRWRVVPACSGCVGRQVIHATLVPGPARGLPSDDHIRHVRYPRFRLCRRVRRLNHTHSGLVVTEASKSGFHVANRGIVSDTVTEESWGKEGAEVYEKEKVRASVEKA